MRDKRPQGSNRGFRGRPSFGRGPPGGDRNERDERFDKRARFMKKARATVMQALRSRDMLLASVTRSIEDLDKSINLLGERYEDWYGIYLPELKAEDKLQFCTASLAIDKDNLDEQGLASILGQKRASELMIASKNSLGAKLSQKDHSECLSLARAIISLEKLRKDYEDYQKELANELCPNMSYVGGPDIAAKLVSHVGSLSRLAMLPASAIQVIGAEKALFKHLKNKRVPPPKHGIIFQHARISSSPKMVRGKIARALANALCLAAKADAFSKRSISADLKKKFDDRYAQIMKEYEAAKAAKAQPPGAAPANPPAKPPAA
ncbi:hypothetical protein L0Y65_01685 [Candidatus Micrarchaeota archaeon]|nr:hypothetical protein [Candidatus Micrarchaeota archaeon]